jgi:hypothetical protein
MNKQQFAAMLMAVLIVLGGAIWGVVLSTGVPSEAKNDAQQTFVPGPKTNSRLEELSAQIDKTAQYELTYGCTQENKITKQKEFCGSSKDKMAKLEAEYNREYIKLNKRTDLDIEKVKKHAREVTENASLELEFTGTFNSPYTEKKPKRVEYYKDNNNNQYVVDPVTNKVIDFTDERINEAPVKDLNTKLLRSKAEAYLSKQVSDFAEIQKTYVFEEGGKGDPKGDSMYVFRWNAPAPVNGEDITPFIMVKLSPSGKIIGFSDTRSLYQ